jgi:hypothetical protein
VCVVQKRKRDRLHTRPLWPQFDNLAESSAAHWVQLAKAGELDARLTATSFTTVGDRTKGSRGGTSRYGLNISSVITERMLKLLASVTIQSAPAKQQSFESLEETARRLEEATRRQIEFLERIERDVEQRTSEWRGPGSPPSR